MSEFYILPTICFVFHRIIDDKTGTFNIDKELLTKLSKNVPKKTSFLKRDLDAKKQSTVYTLKFRLPQSERLDGSVECTLWTPYNKSHNWGRMYLSQNFICFDSRVRDCFCTYYNINIGRIVWKTTDPIGMVLCTGNIGYNYISYEYAKVSEIN